MEAKKIEKTAEILFFVVFYVCFLGNNAVFYRPMMFQR
jgi:hypothetical protein